MKAIVHPRAVDVLGFPDLAVIYHWHAGQYAGGTEDAVWIRTENFGDILGQGNSSLTR